ncbi:hypothetical protein MD484_g7035, partial [Candolleomyces efflorescens]
MFETLKATRTTSSKVISYGLWHPDLSRVEVTVMKGIHFSSMGHSVPRSTVDEDGAERTQKRLELLPEEAIYLIERGTMFCWKESDVRLEGLGGVPMTVQQAYSEMIGKADLTLEKFQVYSYLKRLGYVVTRTRPPNEHYPAAAPFPTRTSHNSIFRYFKRLMGGFSTILCRIFNKFDWWHPLRINGFSLSNKSYGSVYRSMRFIRSGHSVALNSNSPPSPPSPYQIFYNLYKPSTPFKKSSPSPPDFQMVVVNSARTTPMPTLQELSDLFNVLPELPPPLPRQKRPVNHSQDQSKPNEQTKAAPPATSPTTSERSFIRRLFPWAFPTTPQTPTKGQKVNPFMALKSGKKMIIIAAVDSGNISFFKFSEGAFSEWPMA